jgi:hypothetical protein
MKRRALVAGSLSLLLLAAACVSLRSPDPQAAETAAHPESERDVPAQTPILEPGFQPSSEVSDPARPAPVKTPQAKGLDPLVQGSVLRPRRDVLIGLSGFPRLRRGGQDVQLAWFSVGTRPMTYAVEVAVGGRVRAGGYELEVLEIDPERRQVRYRWTAEPTASVPMVQSLPQSAGKLRLRAMGLYRLSDGSVVGVGNVISTDKGGAVSLTVFPASYAKDPMQGYDNHVRVRAGKLDGARAVRLSQVQGAWVELEL